MDNQMGRKKSDGHGSHIDRWTVTHMERQAAGKLNMWKDRWTTNPMDGRTRQARPVAGTPDEVPLLVQAIHCSGVTS